MNCSSTITTSCTLATILNGYQLVWDIFPSSTGVNLLNLVTFPIWCIAMETRCQPAQIITSWIDKGIMRLSKRLKIAKTKFVTLQTWMSSGLMENLSTFQPQIMSMCLEICFMAMLMVMALTANITITLFPVSYKTLWLHLVIQCSTHSTNT